MDAFQFYPDPQQSAGWVPAPNVPSESSRDDAGYNDDYTMTSDQFLDIYPRTHAPNMSYPPTPFHLPPSSNVNAQVDNVMPHENVRGFHAQSSYMNPDCLQPFPPLSNDETSFFPTFQFWEGASTSAYLTPNYPAPEPTLYSRRPSTGSQLAEFPSPYQHCTTFAHSSPGSHNPSLPSTPSSAEFPLLDQINDVDLVNNLQDLITTASSLPQFNNSSDDLNVTYHALDFQQSGGSDKQPRPSPVVPRRPRVLGRSPPGGRPVHVDMDFQRSGGNDEQPPSATVATHRLHLKRRLERTPLQRSADLKVVFHDGKSSGEKQPPACMRCRDLKAKCDHGKPCERCQQQDEECVYRPSRRGRRHHT